MSRDEMGGLALIDPLRLPTAHGEALAHVRLRSELADFEVDEILNFTPDGEGAHALVRVRKSGCNTDWVAGRLAALAGIARRDVGYAGMKDRRARTTQWFSLPLGADRVRDVSTGWETDLGPDVEVLEIAGHRRKLRRGQLAANRFRLHLRSDTALDLAALGRRAEDIAMRGVPNYFGPQRFGHRGGNVAGAVAMFGEGRRPARRHLRGIYLSAARAALFNEVLARRVRDRDWDRILPGEAVRGVTNARAFSHVGCREAAQERLETELANLHVHPTGPMWGEGDLVVRGHCAALERQVLAGFEVLTAGLERARVEAERRPLRLVAQALEVQGTEAGALISFTLGRGGFATSVLRELVTWTEPGAKNE